MFSKAAETIANQTENAPITTNRCHHTYNKTLFAQAEQNITGYFYLFCSLRGGGLLLNTPTLRPAITGYFHTNTWIQNTTAMCRPIQHSADFHFL